MLGFLGLSCQSIELRFRGILLFTARLVIFCLASLKVHTAHRAELYGSVIGLCVDSCLIVEVIYTVFT
ncbi:hypothetical protein ANAPC5_00484 [Anaplasma phagocytophilum]|nr:hypothetical protein ANAPC4_00423 [Anaplasma phagocytophilum]SBO31410.1 hypothetical protein ANAPC2_00643 [Anaplasma phagocytophilum]SBO31472.1 hypothetical protein ANAPC3_00541 [Anaplasma phagocytophilum]SCV63185.1 hypothetical protein ANAPC5_00484 [Anaplasma phagocytophilum]